MFLFKFLSNNLEIIASKVTIQVDGMATDKW